MRRVYATVILFGVLAAWPRGGSAVAVHPHGSGGATATTCVVLDPIYVAQKQITDGYEVCAPVA